MYCSFNLTASCKDSNDFINIKIYSHNDDEFNSPRKLNTIYFEELHTYDNIQYFRNWIRIDRKIYIGSTNIKV